MKTKPYLQGALALSILLSSSHSRAEEPAPVAAVVDAEIQLKNGARLHGGLLSVEPGKQVVILVDGEERAIPWDDVAKIVSGVKEAPPSAPAPVTPAPAPVAPAPATTAPPTEPTKGMPFLHVESDWAEVELQRVDGEIGAGVYTSKNQVGPQTLSKYICEAPCDKLVDGRDGNRFFFSAPGMLPTRQFRLEQHDGYVTARIHGVGLGRFISGVLLTTMGGVFALSGTLLFGFSFLPIKATPQNPDPAQSASQTRVAGLVLGGVGTGMLIGGIYLVSPGQTKLELIKNKRGETALSFEGGAFRF